MEADKFIVEVRRLMALSEDGYLKADDDNDAVLSAYWRGYHVALGTLWEAFIEKSNTEKSPRRFYGV